MREDVRELVMQFISAQGSEGGGEVSSLAPPGQQQAHNLRHTLPLGGRRRLSTPTPMDSEHVCASARAY